jgi:hypothetical protein
MLMLIGSLVDQAACQNIRSMVKLFNCGLDLNLCCLTDLPLVVANPRDRLCRHPRGSGNIFDGDSLSSIHLGQMGCYRSRYR